MGGQLGIPSYVAYKRSKHVAADAVKLDTPLGQKRAKKKKREPNAPQPRLNRPSLIEGVLMNTVGH